LRVGVAHRARHGRGVRAGGHVDGSVARRGAHAGRSRRGGVERGRAGVVPGDAMTLAVQDVHTYYGESHILQGVTFQAAEGVVTAVLGRNGAGKTTLCRTIAGLTPARRGRIVFNGADITRLPAHRICQRHLASVLQGRRLFPSLTVREHLAIAARSTPSTRPSGARSGQVGQPWSIARVFAPFPRVAERGSNRGNEFSAG